MLLPSALPCEAPPTFTAGDRPPLPRRSAYVPRPSPLSANGAVSNLSSTCRALQSLLGVYPPPRSFKSKHPPASGRISKRTPFTPAPASCARPLTPPRSIKKRSWDPATDAVMSDAGPGCDQENLPAAGCATPKRPKWDAPPNMPLGLERRDFFALQATEGNAPPALRVPPAPTAVAVFPDTRSGNDEDPNDGGADESEDVVDWEDEDDRALVALVLDRLQLSRADWGACASTLGVGSGDGTELEKRWRRLVEGGRVGLKLGRGAERARGRRDVREVWR